MQAIVAPRNAHRVSEAAGDTESQEGAAQSVAPAEKAPASPLRRIASAVASAVGILLVLMVMALTVGPRFFPYQAYTVLSGSMEPTLPVGSIIVAVPASAADLRVGDVITMQNPQHPGTLVTHRIFAIEYGPQGRAFKTKGDANRVPDDWIVQANGSGWRYFASVPYVGYVLAWMQGGMGRTFLLVVPTLLLGGLMMKEIWRPRKVAQAEAQGA